MDQRSARFPKLFWAVMLALLLLGSVGTAYAQVKPKRIIPRYTQCQRVTLAERDYGLQGFWNSTYATYFNLYAYLYQNYDSGFGVWCPGMTTDGEFEVDTRPVIGDCFGASEKGIATLINGSNVTVQSNKQSVGPDCDTWYDVWSGGGPSNQVTTPGCYTAKAWFSGYAGSGQVATAPRHCQ